MRTIAYVDGHNLYFSCLKGTPHKWLDLYSLLRRVIATECPQSDLVGIRYFTSPIKGSLARLGQASTDAQAEYIRALRANPRVSVVEGRFSVASASALRHVAPPDLKDRVRIWRIEEKETDVSLAVAMYRDARSGNAEQIVLVSNDSDMIPALRAVQDDTEAQIGVILPLLSASGEQRHLHRASVNLGNHAHWVRSYLSVHELASSQLPPCVQTNRRPARKPAHW